MEPVAVRTNAYVSKFGRSLLCAGRQPFSVAPGVSFAIGFLARVIAKCTREDGGKLLALSHPEIGRKLHSFPGGLLPIRPDGKLSLAIKASKEALLTVQQNRSFSVYVVPMPAMDGEAISIVTAFFDDAAEPLVIRTPLFGNEDTSVELVALLMAEEIEPRRVFRRLICLSYAAMSDLSRAA